MNFDGTITLSVIIEVLAFIGCAVGIYFGVRNDVKQAKADIAGIKASLAAILIVLETLRIDTARQDERITSLEHNQGQRMRREVRRALS